MADLVLPPAPRQSKGRRLRSKPFFVIPFFVALTMVMASCGSSETDTTEAGDTNGDETATSSESADTSTSTTASEASSSSSTSTTTTTPQSSTSATTGADPASTTTEQAVETSTTTTTDESPTTTVTDAEGDPLVAAVIGKTTDEAIEMVRATGRKVRIAVLEGEELALTQDYDPERLNLTISGGIVKSVRLG